MKNIPSALDWKQKRANRRGKFFAFAPKKVYIFITIDFSIISIEKFE